MINVRLGIFETNSSSTHALVVMTKEQYANWSQDDNNCIFIQNDHFTSPDQIKKIYTFDEIKQKYIEVHRSYGSDELPSEREIMDWAKYYGYLPYDNCNSIEGEFENYKILSVYINE